MYSRRPPASAGQPPSPATRRRKKKSAGFFRRTQKDSRSSDLSDLLCHSPPRAAPPSIIPTTAAYSPHHPAATATLLVFINTITPPTSSSSPRCHPVTTISTPPPSQPQGEPPLRSTPPPTPSIPPPNSIPSTDPPRLPPRHQLNHLTPSPRRHTSSSPPSSPPRLSSTHLNTTTIHPPTPSPPRSPEKGACGSADAEKVAFGLFHQHRKWVHLVYAEMGAFGLAETQQYACLVFDKTEMGALGLAETQQYACLVFDKTDLDQRKGVIKDREELLHNVTTRNKMNGKGDASVSNPRMPIRGIRNPNSSGYEGIASEGFEQVYAFGISLFCIYTGNAQDEAENIDDSIPGKVTLSDPIVQYVNINTNSTSYAGAVGASAKSQPKVTFNFRPLMADPIFDGVNISIPREVVKKVSTRFEHALYGYFIGKRMAFLFVEYYARNNWAKYGLKKDYYEYQRLLLL
nr:zinc knuckle CX2CX4HX4C [Tanacetum cinerariifolium]